MKQNKLIRVLTSLYCDPWLLTPTMHQTLTDIVSAHAGGGDIEAEQHAKAQEMAANPNVKQYAKVENTAIIPVDGVIGRKFSSVLYSSGVTSIDVFDRMMKQVSADDSIHSVLLVFDSPGGIATGISEAGQTIKAVSFDKPIISFADGSMNSAAYWLASQTDAIYATESADVGSIGVYMAVLDQSRMAEMMGLKVEMFKSGKHKGMGYPGTSLTDEQRGMLQSRVDMLGAKFRAAVRSNRDGVADDTMQGQSFDAAAALKEKLIDSVATYEEALRDAISLGKKRA